MTLSEGPSTPADLPPHARVAHTDAEYVIELDVSDFTERELSVETIGRRVIVHGERNGGALADDGLALRERLDESLRLPDDADVDRVRAFYAHGTLELRAPRTTLVARPLPIEPTSWHLVDPYAEAC